MTFYKVVWEIELDADSPWEAAKLARDIQLDPESIATVFTISEQASWSVDTAKQYKKQEQPNASR